MEITKREILFSVIILSVMMGIGIWLSNVISFSLDKKDEKIISAVQIYSDVNKFDYIGRTDVGNFLAEGTIYAQHPVSIPDIPGEYLEITKEKQKYTMHMQVYTTSDGKGHVHTHTRVYWSWDHVRTDQYITDSLRFLNKVFSMKEVFFKYGLTEHSIIKESSHIRYIYRVHPVSRSGVMGGIVKDKKYKDLAFNPDWKIDSLIKHKENMHKTLNALFWVGWFLLTGFTIYGFYYAENNWLEDE